MRKPQNYNRLFSAAKCATSSATGACYEEPRKMWTYLISRSSSRSVRLRLRHSIPGGDHSRRIPLSSSFFAAFPASDGISLQYLRVRGPQAKSYYRVRLLRGFFLIYSYILLLVRHIVDYVSLFYHEYHGITPKQIMISNC